MLEENEIMKNQRKALQMESAQLADTPKSWIDWFSRAGWKSSLPSRAEEVALCYRVVLGRMPENPDVLNQWATSGLSLEQMLRAFMNSEEFLSKTASASIAPFYRSPVQTVDTDPSPELLDAMFERVRKQWSALGEFEPYWSVLTQNKYKAGEIAANKNEFHETGRQTAELIDEFTKRSRLDLPRRGICLELGCGVGRVTRYLSERFDKIIAVDVSSGNLQIARQYMAEEKVGNVEFIQVKSISDFDELQGFDFLFSTIVLQHNPPPIQKVILDKLLKAVAVGGGCLFQVPTELPGYSFQANKYLSSAPPDLEMHSLPMPIVLQLLQKHKLTIREVRPDSWTQTSGSFTFFAYPKNE